MTEPQPSDDRRIRPRLDAAASRAFLVAGVLVVGLQLLTPDGTARSLSAFATYLAITGAVAAGIVVHAPVHRAQWVLLATAMAMFTVDMFGWVLEATRWAPATGRVVQDGSRLLATLALLAAIALFVRSQSSPSPRGIPTDGLLIAAGGALMLWQWYVLVTGVGDTDLLARVGVPLLLAGLALAMAIAAARMGVRLLSSESMLLLLGGAVMALAAQAALTLTDAGSGPARWTDATWLTAGILVGAAALHPTMARRQVPQPERRQVATRLMVVGTVLLANPAIVWLHLLQPESDRRVVAVVAIAVALVTLFGVSRAGRLIGDLLRMRVAVARSEDRFRSLVQHASDVITVVDADGLVSYASPSAQIVLGRSPSALIGTPLVDLIADDDAGAFAAFLDRAKSHQTQSLTTEVAVLHSEGEERNAEVITVNLTDEPGVEGLAITIRDVTERARFEAELTHLATHDSLTGLANRALFSDRVTHALDLIGRHRTMVGVVFIDLDDFKTVNDSLGHLAGDELLRTVADRLHKTLRAADTAARLGGDEFAVLLEDIDDRYDAIHIVERISAALQRPVMIDDRRVRLGATMGVALGRAGNSADELLRNADTAMFTAKSAGKGRYDVFEPEMHQAAVSRFDMKADLQQALERGEFQLHYQPIYSLTDGRAHGVEALLRWRHPRRGLVRPAEFISLMEETGQIVAVGRWAMREAFAQARRWQRHDAALWMSVNLSVRQFQQPGLVQDIARTMSETGIRPSDIVLEITESVFIGDTDAAVLQLDRLKQLGVRLAIDDFGTGYSALNYLQRFRADIVKLDRSFVEALGSSSSDTTLAKGIVGLARELGIVTIGEGVERGEQIIDLRDIDCDLAQGFHLAHPKPANEARPYLKPGALVTPPGPGMAG